MKKITLNKTTLLIAALTFSLAGNLYAATYIMGHHTRQHVVISTLARKQIDSMLSALPRDRQNELRKSLGGEMEKLKSEAKDTKQDREQLSQLLTETTLDHIAIKAQFAKLRDDTVSSQEHVQNMMLLAFEKMTPDEREKSVDRILAPEKK